MTTDILLSKSIYLSLGDKEEKAKNPVMAQVANVIRKQHILEIKYYNHLNYIL